MTRERQRLYDWYRQNGVTEEQIQAISAFDDEIEKSDKRFYSHTKLESDLNGKDKQKYWRNRNARA